MKPNQLGGTNSQQKQLLPYKLRVLNKSVFTWLQWFRFDSNIYNELLAAVLIIVQYKSVDNSEIQI